MLPFKSLCTTENAADPRRSEDKNNDKMICGLPDCIPKRPTRPWEASRNAVVLTPASVIGTSAKD